MKVNGREVGEGMGADSTKERATGSIAKDRDEEDKAADVNAGATATESARLELQGSHPGPWSFQAISSPTDEFVRVGEALSLALPASLLWEALYPGEPSPDDARLEQLTATVEVCFHHNTATVGRKVLVVTSFTSSLYGLYGDSAQFLIPSRTDTLSFAITVKDAEGAGATAALEGAKLAPINVFGGDLPNKTLLFDNLLGGVLRQRIIEGGELRAGAKVRIGYTDWRADQMVDKTNINLQIGLAHGVSGGGGTPSPIVGKLVHEVSCGVYFNDAEGFRPEAPLSANTASLLGGGRTNFEATVTIPPRVTEMQLYTHVRSYLIADYAEHADVVEKWYKDNDKVLMREQHDTPHGPYTNYSLPIH